MRRAVYLAGLVASLCFADIALAQDRAWIQIEARPNLAAGEDRARAWSTGFGDVSGYRLDSGWYGIVLGPYSPAEAARKLADLKRQGMVPPDSYITDGRPFRENFWAPGPQNAAGTGALDAALPAPAPAPALLPQAAAPRDSETESDARASEALLTEDQRLDLQSALKWFGFYDAAIDGSFGRGTRASMAAWQAAQGLPATGILTSTQRDQLLKGWQSDRHEFGFETITEPEAGIEIAMPTALVSFDHYEPPFVHYTERDGSGMRVVLISVPGDAAALDALYRDLQDLSLLPPGGARRMDGSSFTIEGRSEAVQGFAQATLARGMIKGFILAGPAEKSEQFGRVLTAMRGSFRPVGDRALDPGLAPMDDTIRAGLMAGLEQRAPRLSRSGFFIDAKGTVATTTQAVDHCGKITIDRDTVARVSHRDAASGLAILTPEQPLAPRAFARIRPVPPQVGAEITVSGYSYEGRLPAPILTFGALAEGTGLAGEDSLIRLSVPVLAGDAGGPVLDQTGAVIGLLQPREGDGARLLPEGVSFALSAKALTAELAATGISPAATQPPDQAATPDALAREAAALTVLVSCWD